MLPMDQCTVQQANQWEWEAIQKLLLSRLKSQWEAKNNWSFQQNLTIQLTLSTFMAGQNFLRR